jgi:hypothetical protein
MSHDAAPASWLVRSFGSAPSSPCSSPSRVAVSGSRGPASAKLPRPSSKRARAAEAARRAALPLPEEPPVELLRTPDSGLPCKVDDVFANKCRRCHTVPTRHGAPLVFLTWDDTRQDRLGQPLYAVIGRAVRTNFMPYRVEANPPVQQLTDEEKKIVLDWVDAGAPREDCSPNAPGAKKAAPVQAKTKAQATPSAQRAR